MPWGTCGELPFHHRNLRPDVRRLRRFPHQGLAAPRGEPSGRNQAPRRRELCGLFRRARHGQPGHQMGPGGLRALHYGHAQPRLRRNAGGDSGPPPDRRRGGVRRADDRGSGQARGLPLSSASTSALWWPLRCWLPEGSTASSPRCRTSPSCRTFHAPSTSRRAASTRRLRPSWADAGTATSPCSPCLTTSTVSTSPGGGHGSGTVFGSADGRYLPAVHRFRQL